jgi:thymidylate synthase (FAD)
MEITLTQYTRQPLNTVYSAARTCTSTLDYMGNLVDCQDIKKSTKAKLINKVLKARHMSVLEHVNLTFSISGVSRALTHQLVRHRVSSVSQQSQRYVTIGEFKYVTPLSIQNNEIALDQYEWLMKYISDTYDEFIKKGIKPEDARFVLPNATETSLVWTMNLREFLHICNERLCVKTQWEFRNLIKDAVEEILITGDFDWLEEYMKPKCSLYGCTEVNGCKEGK